MKIIDLSVSIQESASELLPVKLFHLDHKHGAAAMKNIFDCGDDDLPSGMGWATDRLDLSTHSGTHVDAPWHYFPTTEGERARTIDELPLEWFYGDGVILDMRDKKNGATVNSSDLKKAQEMINYAIKPRDIVLIHTGADKFWGKQEYLDAGCGMGRDATLYLINLGVKVVGTDAWGWDPPFKTTRENFKQHGNNKVIWEGHYAGIEREYCQIEKLANLDKIPLPFGFKVSCFPVKISSASAGWTRAVAILES